jgi:hypothetical protein
VSRVQNETQIRRVILKADEKPTAPIQPGEVDRRIACKLELYRKSDEEKKRPATGPRLSIVDVKALGNTCHACKRPVIWGGYDRADGRQFSVDRIDNLKAHTKGNVRMACLGCNRNHRQT